MLERLFILAASSPGLDLQDLVYLLFALVLPALAGLGKWIRERSKRPRDGVEVPSARKGPLATSAQRPPLATPVQPSRPTASAHAGGPPAVEVILAEFIGVPFPAEEKPTMVQAVGRRERVPLPPKKPATPGTPTTPIPMAKPAGPAGPPRGRGTGRPQRPPPPATGPARPAPRPPAPAVGRAPAARVRPPARAQEVQGIKERSRRAPEPDTTPGPYTLPPPGEWAWLSLEDLRRAIVMNEVLAPPIALRRPASGLRDED